MKETIRVECTGSVLLDIDEIKEFQGELKSLSTENYDRLKSSILEFGISSALYVWQPKSGEYHCFDGHQRLRVLQTMKQEGYAIPLVPVNFVQAKSIKEAKKKLLALASQYGQVDKQGLYHFMAENEISYDDMEDLYNFPEVSHKKFKEEYYAEPNIKGDEDDVSEIDSSIQARAKLGDLYQLGEHRLLCGDSTSIHAVERLMNSEKASVWLSDPPYGINHVETSQEKGQSKGYGDIKNDDLTDDAFKDFILSSIQASLPFMKENFAFYMWHAMKMQGYTAAAAAAAAAGILFHRQIVWVKPQFVFGRGAYHWRHELCLMGWLKGNEPPFYGERNQSTVWEIKRENDKIHPTQKPVEIWKPSILNHTKAEEIVYEPFAGSGSNLIACEVTNRRCFMMELDPHYCDVIITRYLKYVGQTKVIRNGLEIDWIYSNLEENTRSV